MKAEWCEEFATGNESIDRPKKELIRRINGLLDACRERKARNEIGDFLDYLKGYVKAPLLEEEALQLDSRYPFFREHRREHDRFVQKLGAVERDFIKDGASAMVIVATGKLALDWVHDHMSHSDGLMARYVKQ